MCTSSPHAERPASGTPAAGAPGPPSSRRRRAGGLQRPADDVEDVADHVHGERLAHLGRDVVEVGLVAQRHEHLGEAGALGGEQLLLDPADRQHPAVERDLAGHADLGAHRAPGGQRDQRGDHGDAGRRAVLGHGAGGHVHVDPPVQRGRVHPERGGVRAHERQRDLRRLLHHVAELAGEHQAGSPSPWPGRRRPR